MRIVNEKLLKEFRVGPCCWCGRTGRTHPHHVFGRGMGGATRLDVRVNLVSLCFGCHRQTHMGRRPIRVDLLAVVAAREGLMQDEITRTILELRNAPQPR